MSPRLYKWILAVVVVSALAINSRTQQRLNVLREEMGLTRVTPLENAPPALAFSTVALGGFRGIIANYLWMRAHNLQLEGRYFEMMSLADWITKLQPTFGAVWAYQAWNMSYNISREFSNPEDRWAWIDGSIKLLRDEGLRYNPVSVPIYRELSWIFQHKIGSYLDDHHGYYKQQWSHEMMKLLGREGDYSELLEPQTDDQRRRRERLVEEYRLQPPLMKAVDEKYGPLDWRLPEAHAIYWARLGLKNASEESDLIPLHRVIWQSMRLAFERGRLVDNPVDKLFEYGPNLEIAQRTHQTFEEIREVSPEKDYYAIDRAHRAFLSQAVYFFYVYNRPQEAAGWFQELKRRFPDSPGTELALNEFVVQQVQANMENTTVDKIRAIVEGYLVNSYYHLALGDEDQANGHAAMARQIHRSYQTSIQKQGVQAQARVGLKPFREIQARILRQVLDNHPRFSDELKARLRTQLNLPAP